MSLARILLWLERGACRSIESCCGSRMEHVENSNIALAREKVGGGLLSGRFAPPSQAFYSRICVFRPQEWVLSTLQVGLLIIYVYVTLV